MVGFVARTIKSCAIRSSFGIALFAITISTYPSRAVIPDVMEYSLRFSTYLGTNGASAIIVDRQGFIYMAGSTWDTNFPTTPGAISRILRGPSDAFVSKFSPDGQLVYSTLIGGTNTDGARSIRIDDLGNIYVAGSTTSPDFPTTPGAYNRNFRGADDIFALKLESSGSNIVFSTLIGGTNSEGPAVLLLDGSTNLVLCGDTSSGDFPTPTNAYSRTLKGTSDAFACRLSADGTALLASTLFGGTSFENCVALASDEAENIFIGGCTGSANLPVTTNAFKKTRTGTVNGFFAQFTTNLSTLQYSTYYGGSSGYNFVHNLGYARPGRLCASGQTYSTGVPVTNAFQRTLAGDADEYLSVFNTTNMTLIYSTYLGGTLEEFAGISQGMFTMDHGLVALGGITRSANLPVTEHGCDTNFTGTQKFFLSILDTQTNQLLYSTYFGTGQEQYAIMTSDSGGNLYLMGSTASSNYPVTPGAHQTNYPGAGAQVLTKLRPLPIQVAFTLNPTNAVLQWSGGVPPYAVQQTTNLCAGIWHDVATNALPPVDVPRNAPAVFFRVSGH